MTMTQLRRGLRAAIALACALAANPTLSVSAHDYKLGALKIEHPWTRATPPGAKVGGGFLTIENSGSQPDRLLGGTTAVAGQVQVHEMSVVDGVMRMRQLAGGLEIPGNGRIELKPGSFHLMLMDLRRPLKQGERVPITLRFERSGSIEIELEVGAIGAPAGKGH